MHRIDVLLAAAATLAASGTGEQLQPDFLGVVRIDGQAPHRAQLIAFPLSQQFGKLCTGQR